MVELNEAIGTTIDEPMITVGDATDSLPIGVIAIVIVAFLTYLGRRSDALVFLVIVGAAMLLNPVLKYVIGRCRPDVRLSPEVMSTHSFPSGHAASTAALVGALVLVARMRRSRILTAAVGSLVLIVVGFSRLAIGVHYPSDIVGGWLWTASLVGIAWSARAVQDTTPHRKPHQG